MLVLFVLFLAAPVAATAQILTLQSGVSISHLRSKLDGDPYDFLGQNRIDLSEFAGFEYLEKKYWSISSNVGFVRKGGKEPAGDSTLSEGFNYVSLNTTFNLKYPIGPRLVSYFGLGPRIDLLLNHDHTFPYFDNPGFVHKLAYGAVAAVGIRYAFQRFLLGIRAEHLFEFDHLVSHTWEVNDTETSIVSLTMGVRLTRK